MSLEEHKTYILELSQDMHSKVTGRTNVKFVIHEIFDSPNEYQGNGISWNPQYTFNNIESAKGMPLCVEFLDYDRAEPFGHGLSGSQDKKPLFEYSTVVGVISNAYIDNNLEVNGQKIKALVGEGYIYEQRYPKFVQWLKSQKYDNKAIESSIELCAKAGNESIIYDGGWKEKGRVPQIYDYTGHAILGVEPADDSAVLLELNSGKKLHEKLQKLKEEKEMAATLDPKDQMLLELNTSLQLKTVEFNTLTKNVSDKEAEFKEVSSNLEKIQLESNAKDVKITALETSNEENIKKFTDQETELNELRKFKADTVDKELVVELNSALADFTADEKLVVKAKVDAFTVKPSKEGIISIVSEINQAITTKVLDARKGKVKEEKNTELNNKNLDIDSGIYEVNSEKDDEDSDSIY